MNVVLFILNQLFMSSHFSNFMVGMIVLMTPGRSRASAYLQMKYIHNKLAKDNESVLILAACRDNNSEDITNETMAYFDNGNVELEIFRKSDDWFNEIIARFHSEADNKANPSIEVFFAGGEKLIYLKAYQTLSLDKNYTNVLSITEPDMATAVGFTIDDWLVANKSKKVNYIAKEDTLKFSGGLDVKLTNTHFKSNTNPTRLFCSYLVTFSSKSKRLISTIKQKKERLRKNLEKINILFNELNLINDIRVNLTIEIKDSDNHIYSVYYDEKFLTRNGFIFLMLDPNLETRFYNAPSEVNQRFEVLRRMLHGGVKREKNETKIRKFFSDIPAKNKSRIDGMKWLIGHKYEPKFDFTRTHIVDGYNGRELNEIVASSNLLQTKFASSKECINFDDELTTLSAFIMSLNSHYYTNLSNREFSSNINRMKEKFSVKPTSNKDKPIFNSNYVTISNYTLTEKGTTYEFNFSSSDKTITMKTENFAEMLHSIAYISHQKISLFASEWTYDPETNTILGKENLTKSLGIFHTDHTIDADCYTLYDNLQTPEFGVIDINSISSFNTERILDKYEKYEKLSSKFPFPIYTEVFSIFSWIDIKSESKENIRQVLDDNKENIKQFVASNMYRRFKYLDLSFLKADSESNPVRINIELLGRFLADRETDIHGFAEWCDSKSEVGLEILEEE